MAIARGHVIVSGSPGAGKSTLAAPLAAGLGLPLLGKDIIKEAMFDHIPMPPDQAPGAWSKILGAASMELLWRLAGLAPAVVLEANFRPRSDYERSKIVNLSGPVIEIYCRCPPELAAQRYAARHVDRHPTHVSGTISLEQLAEFDQPLALGPVIEVDMTAPMDIAGLIPRIEALLVAA